MYINIHCSSIPTEHNLKYTSPRGSLKKRVTQLACEHWANGAKTHVSLVVHTLFFFACKIIIWNGDLSYCDLSFVQSAQQRWKHDNYDIRDGLYIIKTRETCRWTEACTEPMDQRFVYNPWCKLLPRNIRLPGATQVTLLTSSGSSKMFTVVVMLCAWKSNGASTKPDSR